MYERIIIVGASGALGSAVSRRMSKKYQVILADRELRDESLLQVDNLIAFENVDLRNVGDCKRVGQIAADHDVSAVVNCAGIARDGTVSIPDADLVDLIDINLLGAIRIANAVVPHFLRRGGGNLVTIVSRSGLYARKNLGGYAASKFGFIGYSEALNLEYADQPIRSTCICPGLVNTPMSAEEDFPKDALIQPEDVAACVELPLRLSAASMLLPVFLEPKCQINSLAPSVTGSSAWTESGL